MNLMFAKLFFPYLILTLLGFVVIYLATWTMTEQRKPWPRVLMVSAVVTLTNFIAFIVGFSMLPRLGDFMYNLLLSAVGALIIHALLVIRLLKLETVAGVLVSIINIVAAILTAALFFAPIR